MKRHQVCPLPVHHDSWRYGIGFLHGRWRSVFSWWLIATQRMVLGIRWNLQFRRWLATCSTCINNCQPQGRHTYTLSHTGAGSIWRLWTGTMKQATTLTVQCTCGTDIQGQAVSGGCERVRRNKLQPWQSSVHMELTHRGRQYLAVVNGYDGTSYNLDSPVYIRNWHTGAGSIRRLWTGTTEQATSLKVQCTYGTDTQGQTVSGDCERVRRNKLQAWKSSVHMELTHRGRQYLAIVNGYDGTSYNLDSPEYIWNRHTGAGSIRRLWTGTTEQATTSKVQCTYETDTQRQAVSGDCERVRWNKLQPWQSRVHMELTHVYLRSVYEHCVHIR